MNHLDLGYSLNGGSSPIPGLLANVLNMYFHSFFPRAISLATSMRDLGLSERFIYTTHPFLVSLFLDCPNDIVLSNIKVFCPTAAEVESFEEAVKQGDITYIHSCIHT